MSGTNYEYPRLTLHTVRAGDTIYALSKEYNTTVDAILSLNPKAEPYNLQIGTALLIMPHSNVLPDQGYGYDHDQLIGTPIQTLPGSVPSCPTAPVAPVAPPVYPVAPTYPIHPSNPVIPISPSAPTKPTHPIAPILPSTPTMPVSPVLPSTPTMPVTPTTPVAPIAPILPSTPTMPIVPTTPITPIDSTRYTHEQGTHIDNGYREAPLPHHTTPSHPSHPSHEYHNKVNHSHEHNHTVHISHEFAPKLHSLWTQKIYWLRMLVTSIADKLGDTNSIISKLGEIASSIGSLYIKPAGRDYARTIHSTMGEHLRLHHELLHATRDNRPDIDTLRRRTYAHNEKLADAHCLASNNADKEVLKRLFCRVTDLTTQQLGHRLNRNYKADIACFDDLEKVAYEITTHICNTLL